MPSHPVPTYSSLPFPHGKFLCHESCPESARAFLLELSTTWTTEGVILKNGSRSTVLYTTIDGFKYVLKIYKKMPLHRRLRYAFTQSRAFQSWNSGLAMIASEIPVAQPLAIIEERQFHIPGRAILLMAVAHGDDLLSLIEKNKLTTEQLEEIATKLTRIFQKMASSLLTHGDMKATNILINDNHDPMLIDIDGGILHSSQKKYLISRAKDKARFMKNWQTHPEAQEAFRDVFDKTH